MFLTMYRSILRTPNIKGRHRIDNWLRRRVAQPSELVYGGVRMLLDPQEWLQIELMSGRGPEPLTAALLERLLEPSDTLVDIGAHVGWLTLIGAKVVGAAGRVIAVDPQPYNCDHILTNAQLNGFHNITVVAGAVGEEPGPVRLRNQCASDKARLTLDGDGVNDTGAAFLTHVYSLPQLLEMVEVSSVKLLKVDVEGFEIPVLRGAVPVLNRVQNIVFEHLPEKREDFETIRALLSESGFELVTVEGDQLNEAAPPENNIWARREIRAPQN